MPIPKAWNHVAPGKKEMRVHVWAQTHQYIQAHAKMLGVPVSCFVDHLVGLHRQKFQLDQQFHAIHARLDDLESHLKEEQLTR
jgi:hypothetical protein